VMAKVSLPKLKLYFGFQSNRYFSTWSPLTLTGSVFQQLLATQKFQLDIL